MDQSDEMVDLDKVEQVISINHQNSNFAFKKWNNKFIIISFQKTIKFDVKTACTLF